MITTVTARTAPTPVIAASEDGFEGCLGDIRQARIKVVDHQKRLTEGEQRIKDNEINARHFIDFLVTQGHDRAQLEQELREALQFDHRAAWRSREP